MSGRFTLHRLLQLIPTAAAIVAIGFVLIHLAPGDPIIALAGEHGDAEYYAFMRERFALDASLPEQLLTYFRRVLTGDFGHSYVQGRGSLEIILERVPATLLLTGTALVIAVVVAIPLGALAGHRPNGARDVSISTVALGLYSAPVFWIGQLALIALAFHAGLFPVQGMTEAASTATGPWRALEVLRHLTLPALVLASQELAVLVRLTRSGVTDEMTRDHVRTARAKGVSERMVLARHALPRAVVPSIAVIGARAGQLIAGAVIVEIVFGWPGMGRLLLTSLQTRDTPVLLGLFFVVSFAVIVMNLITDLAHAALDPRTRLA